MTAKTGTEMTLPELKKFDGELFIKNNTANRITFREGFGVHQRVNFELDPAGEPDSISFLPKAALDMRGLQKLWMRGQVSISSDPEMLDQIMLLNATAVSVSEARMAELMGSQTENESHRDLEEKLCLICGVRNKEGVVERGRVLQSRRQVKEGLPPLCSDHSDQVTSFVPRLVSDKGEEHWEFDSVKLGK